MLATYRTPKVISQKLKNGIDLRRSYSPTFHSKKDWCHLRISTSGFSQTNPKNLQGWSLYNCFRDLFQLYNTFWVKKYFLMSSPVRLIPWCSYLQFRQTTQGNCDGGGCWALNRINMFTDGSCYNKCKLLKRTLIWKVVIERCSILSVISIAPGLTHLDLLSHCNLLTAGSSWHSEDEIW